MPITEAVAVSARAGSARLSRARAMMAQSIFFISDFAPFSLFKAYGIITIAAEEVKSAQGAERGGECRTLHFAFIPLRSSFFTQRYILNSEF